MRCAWRMCWKRCLGIRWIHAICDSVVIHAICGIEESCGFYSIFKRSIYSYIQWASFQSILTHALILNAQYINFPLFIAQFPRISIAKCIFDGSSFSKKKKTWNMCRYRCLYNHNIQTNCFIVMMTNQYDFQRIRDEDINLGPL